MELKAICHTSSSCCRHFEAQDQKPRPGRGQVGQAPRFAVFEGLEIPTDSVSCLSFHLSNKVFCEAKI